MQKRYILFFVLCLAFLLPFQISEAWGPLNEFIFEIENGAIKSGLNSEWVDLYFYELIFKVLPNLVASLFFMVNGRFLLCFILPFSLYILGAVTLAICLPKGPEGIYVPVYLVKSLISLIPVYLLLAAVYFFRKNRRQNLITH